MRLTKIPRQDCIIQTDSTGLVKDLKKILYRYTYFFVTQMNRLFKDMYLILVYLVIFLPEKILKIDMVSIIWRFRQLFRKEQI